MELRAGQRLYSTVSDAQFVVVKAPGTDVEIACGGAGMSMEEVAPSGGPDLAIGDGPLLGKRYVDDDAGLELLCTVAGAGALTVDGRIVRLREAKALPSSD